jgi:hypothetical protein
MRARAYLLTLLVVFTCLLLAGNAYAAKGQDRVQFGQTIVVAEDENVEDVVCIGCAIRLDGTANDVVAIGGSVTVNGTVKGDLVAVGGGATLRQNATVNGDVTTVGGRLWRDPGAVVKGDISSQSGTPIFLGLILVPLVPIVLIVALVVWLLKPKRPPQPAPGWQPPPVRQPPVR